MGGNRCLWGFFIPTYIDTKHSVEGLLIFQIFSKKITLAFDCKGEAERG